MTSSPHRTVRGAVALVGVVVLSVLGLAPAHAQSDEIVVEQLDSNNYPLVRAVVSGPAPTGELDDAFLVTEDGEEVVIDVVKLRGDDLHVVVAVDESGSMSGAPIEAAKAAVNELATLLPAGSEVSLVGFGEQVRTIQDFTPDPGAIAAATAQLFPFGETALYDGIAASLDALASAGGSSALVVLSDGKDTASLATLESLTDRLGGAEVLTSIVTLETADYDSTVASLLAEAAGGAVIPVTETGQLGSAFQQVASGLGNLFEIRWRSRSTNSTSDVTIGLRGDDSTAATTSFNHDPVKEFVPDVADEVIVVGGAGVTSAPWIPIVAALGVSVGALVLLQLFRTSSSSVERRERREADRVFEESKKKSLVAGMGDRIAEVSTSVLESSGKGRSLDERLERAGLAVTSGELVTAGLGGAVASLAVGWYLFGVPFGLTFVLLPVLVIPAVLNFLTARRRKQFVGQLGDTLQMMTGSLTAGYGLGQTLDAVAREAPSPTADEFARVVMETRLGRTVEDALDAMSHRIQSPDFDWVVDAIKIQASVGGNLSEIIEQVGDTIRARTRIRRQVDALTAEGKISALVLFVLPFGLAGFIFMSNPEYIEPMFSTTKGFMMLGFAGVLMTAGGAWLKKLVNPEF